MFSALKQGGKRLYELARAGQEVERAPRRVTVRRLDITVLDANRIRLHAEVSKGTYIRALATDIGAFIGCGAHLTALRRVAAGFASLDDAQALDAFEATPRLLPPLTLAGRYSTARLSPSQVAEIRHGRAIRDATLSMSGHDAGRTPIVLVGPDDAVLGLAEQVAGRGLQPRRLLNAP
jgi:tRNA pseudouridine55 synthase